MLHLSACLIKFSTLVQIIVFLLISLIFTDMISVTDNTLELLIWCSKLLNIKSENFLKNKKVDKYEI